MTLRPYLTTREAAERAHRPAWKIRQHIREGRLEATVIVPPVARHRHSARPIIQITPQALEAYLAAYGECSTGHTP